MESVISFVRSFWRPIVVVLLALVLTGQLISWGYTALQMHSIDGLISAAENEEKEGKSNRENPQRNPGRRSNSPGLQPKADIFLRRKPSYQLMAIYKDQAVINGRTLKAGERIEKATLVEILLASVMIQEDGKPQQEIKMFQGGGDAGGGPMMRGRMGRGRMGRGGPPGAPSVQVVRPQMSAGAPSAGGSRFSREGLSSDERSKMREIFMGLRDGTVNIDDIPEEYRERFARMQERMASGEFGGRRELRR